MQSSNTPKVVGGVVISVVIVLGIYFALASNTADDTQVNNDVVVSTSTQDTSQSTSSAPANEVTVTTVDSVENTYADGTYSASGTYTVPRGDVEPITVTLTLENDKIVSYTVNTEATNGTSAQYQERFDRAIDEAIEGTDLDEADVSRLGGASLTSDAYNNLLEAIRNEARS